jgi:periplasmic copper chaperone A
VKKSRFAVLAALVVGVLAVAALPAGAHVSVTPSSAPKGGFQVLSFNVPNEEADANTVKLEVTIPTKNPIAFVSYQPMPGWEAEVEKTTLAKPVKTDDGEITEAVSKITWTATGEGLAPGQFDLFTISAGPLPTKGNKVVFKAVQTYSNGEVVSWIQQTVKGAPEPERPAPALTLTSEKDEHSH